MKSKQEILRNLANFTGTEQYHRWSPLFKNVVLTDGTMYLAEQGIFWLMDVIGSLLPLPIIKKEPFLTAVYNKENQLFTLDDGNGNVLYSQDIPSPTFPLDSIRLFVTDGEGYKVIMLPQEY